MLTENACWLVITPNPARDFTVIGSALVILVAVCYLVRYVFMGLETLERKLRGQSGSAPRAGDVAKEEIARPDGASSGTLSEQELFVVIAAAVAATLKKPHRIITIEPISGAWSLEGRARHHSSHNIR